MLVSPDRAKILFALSRSEMKATSKNKKIAAKAGLSEARCITFALLIAYQSYKQTQTIFNLLISNLLSP